MREGSEALTRRHASYLRCAALRAGCSSEYSSVASGCSELVDQMSCDRQERLDDVGVELRSRAAFDLADRLPGSQRSAVGAIADHGVKCVDDREDPGRQWDFILTQAPRISGSIPTLMVVGDYVVGQI